VFQRAVLDVILASGLTETTDPILQHLDDVTNTGVDPAFPLLQTAAFALVFGAVLLVGAPEYADALVGEIRDEPLTSFWWGLKTLFVAIATFFLLVLSVVGIDFLVPAAFAFIALNVLGSVVGALAILDGISSNRWVVLAVAVVGLASLHLLAVVGSIVGFVVGSAGMGGIVRKAA